MLLRDEEDDVKRDLILDQYVPYRMAVLAHMMSEGFAKRYSQEFDMTIGEWRVMANLGHQVFNKIGELATDYEDDVCASLSTEEYAALDRILRKLSKRAQALI